MEPESSILGKFPHFTFILLVKYSHGNYNNTRYMIASKQIKNTEIFTFLAVLVFKLLSRKVLFIKRRDDRNC